MLGLSQREVATRLSVSPTTLSNWEQGLRAITVDFGHLDDALGAGGTVAGLLWAFGSVDGLEPRRVWSHIFDGPSSPVWAWIRSPAPSVKLEGEWGLFGMAVDLDLGPNGAFIAVGASVSGAALVGQLSEAGWIDFGRGELPEAIPGAVIIEGLDVVTPSSSVGVFEETFSADVADRFSRTHPTEVARVARRAPRTLATFLRTFTRSPADKRAVSGPWPPLPDGTDHADRLRYQRLREARSLSLAETVARLDEQTEVSISRDTLRRFETRPRGRHQRLLPVALDHVLRASGQLAVIEIRSDRGSGTVQVPHFWRAPTWLAFDGPSKSPAHREVVHLRWGDWGRELQLSLPALVVMHYSEPNHPLRIHAAGDVRWTAGLGRRSGAMHIDQGWAPANLEVLQRTVAQTEQALFEAMQHRSDPPGDS